MKTSILTRNMFAALCGLAPSLLLPTALVAPAKAQDRPVYKDAHAPLEARVSDLMSRLTTEEKFSLLTGTGFATRAIPRLGVPAMPMADAGQGVRGGERGTEGPATLFPSGVAMASTWDPALIGRVARAIGEEARNKGTGAHVLLGPAINIHRSPLGGRNGEYFSEDPFLAARLTVGYVRGMQSAGVAACIKHYACNNEEVDRDNVDVRVGERALREIYLPAFEAGATEGHAWSLMSAYNRINGPHATANEYLLTEVLKKGWGWDGLVMSDWGAVHETAGVVNAGNDLEMPGGDFLRADRVAEAVHGGQVSLAAVDESARRIVRAIIRVGLLDGPMVPNHAMVDSPAHRRLAYEAATQGIVLLKNERGVLPLLRSRLHSIAVIGRGAMGLQFGAAGSPEVSPAYSVQPLDGLRRRAGKNIAIRYAPGSAVGVPVPAGVLAQNGAGGLRAEYFNNRSLQGPPALVRASAQVNFDWGAGSPAPGVNASDFSVRWTGQLNVPETGRYTLTLSADDGYRLFLNGKRLIDHWVDASENAQSAVVTLEKGRPYNLRIEYYQAGGAALIHFNWNVPGLPAFQEAVNAARRSDAAIIFVSTKGTEGEGNDRPSMALPNSQDALIQAIAAVNKRTIVVLNNGTPVLMTAWLRRVPALVEGWFPGETGGDALAAILFGDANPSGKLPDTLGARREDYPDYGHFPGTNGHVDYTEGIYEGYRHFDKRAIAPLFPFGHGLSYTTFRYSNVRLSRATLGPNGTVTALVDVTNTGRRAGAEVVQLYVHDLHPRIDKPVRELKGFQKVSLAPKQTKTVRLTLAARDLAYCDVPGKQWKADPGPYELQIGASSRDTRGRARLTLTATFSQPIPYMEDQMTGTH